MHKPGFLKGFTLLLAFQFAGEALVALTHVPIPGPVLGMALLFSALLWRGHSSASLQQASGGLLGNLSLLFVPAGVGALLGIATYAKEGLAIAIAVLVSTVLTLWSTAWVLHRLGQRHIEDTP